MENLSGDEYNVVLLDFDEAQKIAVVQQVLQITGLGLREAKDLVDKAPKLLKKRVPRDTAIAIQKQLGSVGGIVEIHPVNF